MNLQKCVDCKTSIISPLYRPAPAVRFRCLLCLGHSERSCLCRLLNRYYLPALFSRGGKTFTLAVAAGLALLGGFGLSGLEMGLEPQLAAPTDFYLQASFSFVFRAWLEFCLGWHVSGLLCQLFFVV